MLIIDSLANLANTIVGGFLESRRRKQELERVRVEADTEVYKAKAAAKITLMQTKAEADIAWDNNALETAGWKDEWFTIVLSIPLIMCFVPSLAPYVAAGFGALASTPEWYQAALGVAISASFGIKKFADFMAKSKGAKGDLS